MNAEPVVKPVQYPAIAKNRYTPAKVLMKRLVFMSGYLFTSPQNSHIVSPVMSAKRHIRAYGWSIQPTITTTNTAPVMALTMRFFILSVIAFCLF